MHGLEDLIKIIKKDNNLFKLLKNEKYFSIIIGKYPYHMKKELLNSNEELKQWFKELVEKRREYLCKLVNNDPFLIYQMVLLYYNLFKKIPEELLARLKPEDLLFDFEDIEKELTDRYLGKGILLCFEHARIKEDNKFFKDFFKIFLPYKSITKNGEISEEYLKILIPIMKCKYRSFSFGYRVCFWYNVWKKFGPEYCIKAWKLFIDKTYCKDYINLILDCILEDKELTEHFNPFFVLGHLFGIGEYHEINIVPLFIGSKEKLPSLLIKLLLLIYERRKNYDEETINEAINIINKCRMAIEIYPRYCKDLETEIKDLDEELKYDVQFIQVLKLLLPEKWTMFTIYGLNLELLVRNKRSLEKPQKELFNVLIY